jgi:cobalt-zinc-cadmium efflux system outer membrane protein
MKSRIRSYAVAMVAGFFGLIPIGMAEDDDDHQRKTRMLSLAEALAIADKAAPSLRLGESRIREAAATKVGANIRLPVNPRLSFDGRPGLDRESRGHVGYASSLDFLFELGDVPGSRVREADARVELARAEQTVNRVEVQAQAMRAYTSALLAGLRLAQTEEAIAIAERILAATQDRLSAGAGSDIEVTSARIELATLRAEVYRAEGELAGAEIELRFLLGFPSDDGFHLTTTAARPPPLPSIETLLAYALEHRPDFVVMRSRLVLLSATDERLRREARPKLGVTAGLDASPLSPMFGSLGLSIELPLAQRNQGPRALVSAERYTENLRLEIERRRLEFDLRATMAGYTARLGELDQLTREGIPAAEQRLQLVETGWRSGRFDIFRLTSAARELIQMKSARLTLLQELWAERASVAVLTGGWFDERP